MENLQNEIKYAVDVAKSIQEHRNTDLYATKHIRKKTLNTMRTKQYEPKRIYI